MRLKLWPLLLLLLFTGCSYNPLSSDSNNLSGNGAGGAFGAAIGIASATALSAPRPLVIGAGIGGTALGYYMTTLRYDAGPIYHAGGVVYTQGEYTGISIPSYRLFEPNSAEFIPQAEPLLNSAIAVLKRYPNSNILVSGNTGGLGTHHFNQKLSEARARQVAAYLWAHGINNFKSHNITTRRLRFVGYDDYFPIADATKAGNIQKNSRIQITAYPSKDDLKLDKISRVFNNVGGYSDL